MHTAARAGLAALALAGCCAATPLPKHLVCYDDTFPPYFMEQANRLTGLNLDVVAEAFRRIGVSVEFRRLPWVRLELELRRGKDSLVECAFAFSHTATRDAYMEFSKVTLQATEYTLFVRDDESDIHALPDLNGKVIGARHGFRLPDAIVAGIAHGQFHLDEAEDDPSSFLKLVYHRVDAVLSNADVGWYVIKSRKLAGIHTLSPPVSHLDNYLVLNRGKALGALLPDFDHALLQMQRDGTYARLRAKYLGEKH